MSQHIYTIKHSDIGKWYTRHNGELLNIGDAIGYIQQCDIGKRVYRVRTNDNTGSILQVESNEQLERRLSEATR